MEVTRARYSYNQSRRRMPRKIRWRYIFAGLIISAAATLSVVASQRPVEATGGDVVSLIAKPAEPTDFNWPRAGQAILADSSGQVLTSSGSDDQQPIASITKVITALVILEKTNLQPGQQGETHIISQADVDLYRGYIAKLGSVMPVRVGQRITTYQALQGLMLPSSNNIADSLAVWHFGSLEEYVSAANEFLARHDLKKTVVDDASGFSPGSQSSPSDLVKLGKMALDNPVLAEIVNFRQATIPDSGEIKNSNRFLQNDPAAIGIKTGSTDEAGYCLLLAFRHGPDDSHVLLGAVLGQPSLAELYAEVNSLKAQALASYRTVEIAPAGTVVGKYQTAWGQEIEAVTLDPVTSYVWSGKEQTLSVALDDIGDSEQAGTVVGSAWPEGDESAKTRVIIRSAVNPPSFFWKLRHIW